MPDADRFAAIRAAETSLLTDTVRGDRGLVEELLHPAFTEIGRSGRVWDRAEIIDALAREGARDPVQADEWRFDALTSDLVLVTYRIISNAGTSRHSSIWETRDGRGPQIRFHQGTVVPPAAD